VDDLARFRAGNPAAFAGPSGDFPVERHGPFGDDPRPARLDEFSIGCVEPPGLSFQQSDLDGDAGRSKFGDAAALDRRERVRLGHDHAAYAATDHRLRAGGRFALVATRFEGDVERGACRSAAGDFEGLDFGVRAAEPSMKPLADDFGPLGHDAADHWVRLDESLAACGQFQRPPNMPEVDFVLVHGWLLKEAVLGRRLNIYPAQGNALERLNGVPSSFVFIAKVRMCENAKERQAIIKQFRSFVLLRIYIDTPAFLLS
jgi:hypothetical protein